MRTAEEILNKHTEFIFTYAQRDSLNPMLIKAINDARIEAIKDCAEKAVIKQTGNKRTSVPTGSNFNSVMAHIPVYEVDKQSILSLIKQLK